MAWNFGSSILGDAEATAKDVEREADVIFTAAFRLVRTEDDRRSMKQPKRHLFEGQSRKG